MVVSRTSGPIGVRQAHAEARIRLALTLCFVEPLRDHVAALDTWWQRVRLSPACRGLAWWRDTASVHWRPLPAAPQVSIQDLLFPAAMPLAAPRWIECADEPAVEIASTRLTFHHLPRFGTEPRASIVQWLVPGGTSAAHMIQWGEAALAQLPLWWGQCGHVFEPVHGRPDLVSRRIAELAKRYWCVQWSDLSTLSWVAPRGLPDVAWLTLLSSAAAEARGATLDGLAAAAEAESLFHRRSARGLTIAVGRGPMLGDVNAGEDAGLYAAAAMLLQPLRAEIASPHPTDRARDEAFMAWRHRFTAPQAWQQADVQRGF
jgi:hypothetical protein